MPSDDLIERAKQRDNYFIKEGGEYRLKTSSEYMKVKLKFKIYYRLKVLKLRNLRIITNLTVPRNFIKFIGRVI